VTDRPLSMQQIRDEWVEFMTTLHGESTGARWYAEWDRAMSAHNKDVSVATLGMAKTQLKLDDLASSVFIAPDGVPSIGVNTNDDAKNKVLTGLDNLIRDVKRRD
jgi:hypothetical protein